MNEEFLSEKFQPYAYYNEDMDYIELYMVEYTPPIIVSR